MRQKFSRFSWSNTSSRKFVPTKIISSKIFLLTSQAQYLWLADPVNCQKVDLFCCRSIEQTAEIFCVLRSTRRNCEYILGVSSLPSAWQFFTYSDRHALISMEILLSFRCWKCTLWVTNSMREILGGAVRHCDLVVKIKITRNFFSGVFIGDLRNIIANFPAIQYHFEQNNWSTFSYSLSHYSNKCHSTSSFLSFWSEPKNSSMCDHWSHMPESLGSLTRPFPSWDWDWQLLVWFYSSFFSFSVAKTWVSYINYEYHVCLHMFVLCLFTLCSVCMRVQIVTNHVTFREGVGWMIKLSKAWIDDSLPTAFQWVGIRCLSIIVYCERLFAAIVVIKMTLSLPVYWGMVCFIE